ncbi:MAG: hypothetical protein QW385_03320 [Thermoproteota archaeon]
MYRDEASVQESPRREGRQVEIYDAPLSAGLIEMIPISLEILFGLTIIIWLQNICEKLYYFEVLGWVLTFLLVIIFIALEFQMRCTAFSRFSRYSYWPLTITIYRAYERRDKYNLIGVFILLSFFPFLYYLNPTSFIDPFLRIIVLIVVWVSLSNVSNWVTGLVEDVLLKRGEIR